MHRLGLVAASLMAMLISAIEPASAQSRVALVIGNSAYQGAPPLSTTVADATLIAQTLQTAGYDVTGVADLTKATIGTTLRTFLDKVAAGGPDSVAFIYFAGYGAQLGSDDYIIPVDARITSPESVGSEALPLSTVISELEKIPSAARIIVLDAARDGGFGKQTGKPVPPGLALIGAPPGFLVAYSAAPNAVATDGNGPNSPYAAALATVMQQPGLDIEQVLKGVRLQMNQASSGTQTPWMTSLLNVTVKLFDAPSAAAAPPKTLLPALGVAGIAVPPAKPKKVTKNRLREMPDDEAYLTAIESDSLEDYQWFVETHPHDARAGQIWDLIDRRREAILWHRTQTIGSRRAYWNYLKRYPDGAHAWEARNWLNNRGDGLPPRNYVAVPDNLPPGYYDEAVGVPDVVPDGFVAPPTVFDSLAPVFVPRPKPWQPKQVIITIQPPQQQQQTLPNNAQALIPPRIVPRQNTRQQQAVQPIIISKPADAQQQKLLQGVIHQLNASQKQSELSKMTDQQLKDQMAKSASDWQKKRQQQQQGKQPQNTATAPSLPANSNAATPSASLHGAVPSSSVSSAHNADTAAGKIQSQTLRPRPLQIPTPPQHPSPPPNKPVAAITPARPLLPNSDQRPVQPVNTAPPNKLAAPNGPHPVEPIKPVNVKPNLPSDQLKQQQNQQRALQEQQNKQREQQLHQQQLNQKKALLEQQNKQREQQPHQQQPNQQKPQQGQRSKPHEPNQQQVNHQKAPIEQQSKERAQQPNKQPEHPTCATGTHLDNGKCVH